MNSDYNNSKKIKPIRHYVELFLVLSAIIYILLEIKDFSSLYYNYPLLYYTVYISIVFSIFLFYFRFR